MARTVGVLGALAAAVAVMASPASASTVRMDATWTGGEQDEGSPALSPQIQIFDDKDNSSVVQSSGDGFQQIPQSSLTVSASHSGGSASFTDQQMPSSRRFFYAICNGDAPGNPPYSLHVVLTDPDGTKRTTDVTIASDGPPYLASSPPGSESALTPEGNGCNYSFAPPSDTSPPPPGPNHPPVAHSDTQLGLQAVTKVTSVLSNDTDPDHDPLHVIAHSNGHHGSTKCTSTSCRYLPNKTFSGNDSYSYKISDGRGGTSSARVFIRVRKLGRQTRSLGVHNARHGCGYGCASASVAAGRATTRGAAHAAVAPFSWDGTHIRCAFSGTGTSGVGGVSYRADWMQEAGPTGVNQMRIEYRVQAYDAIRNAWADEQTTDYDTGTLNFPDAYTSWTPKVHWDFSFPAAFVGYHIRAQIRFRFDHHHFYGNSHKKTAGWYTLCSGDPTP